jgi:hypothetical protein
MRYHHHHHHHHQEARHLRKLGRTAVWNREKTIILIAMGVWVTDVAFLIIGEYPLPIVRSISYKHGDITGAARVNFSTLTILDLLGLFASRRSVFRGRMSAASAPC